MNEFSITKAMVLEVTRETSKRMRLLKDQFIDGYDVHMSNKNLSEILSKVMEKVAADVFTKHLSHKVEKATSDREPDLFFTKNKKPLEIKVTSTDTTWTGGEFSKRPFDYLLVSWGKNFDEFFVALTHLEKKDWTSRMSQSYYGPSFSVKNLIKKKDKEVFIGSFNENGTKLIRERI